MSTETASLSIAVLAVSDSRTLADDRSGDYLAEQLQASGHRLADRRLCADDRYHIRAQISAWIADPETQVIIVTGGTGLTGRDITPEAIRPLLDREIEGFGALFRQLSYQDIGTSTVQSRAMGGQANGKLIFVLPGSTGACRLAWERILSQQLDSRHRPCNFAELMPRFNES